MLNKYLAMKKFLDAEMLKIKADLKPQVKVEVSNFVDTIFKEFDKLGAMSALYVDMAGLLKFIAELKPECGCAPADCFGPAHTCEYHLEQERMELYGEESYLTPKEAQEITEKYRDMVWSMQAQDLVHRDYSHLAQAEELDADDDDLPF